MDKEEIRKKALQESKENIRQSVDRDKHLEKAVKQLDQLNNSINEEVDLLRDWYSLHFPELEEEINDNEEFSKIINKFGVQKEELKPFEEMAEKSTGSSLPEKETEILETCFRNIENMSKTRDELKQYVEETAKDVIPNLSTLLEPLLAARMVSQAGGVENLAKQPASTIQMLGAEKALFRYLKGEGTPPKHGVLFHHSMVRKLPDNERGKMARFLANKAALCARIDQYSDKTGKGAEYREEAQKKFVELQK